MKAAADESVREGGDMSFHADATPMRRVVEMELLGF